MSDNADKRQKSERRGSDRRMKDIPVKVERRKAVDRRAMRDRRKTS